MFSTTAARTDQPNPNANPVIAPPHVHALLNRLHELSIAQEKAVTTEAINAEGFDNFMRDKFIALDQEKCWYAYQHCLASGARNVVEVRTTFHFIHRGQIHADKKRQAGTSFGVSTIYLALAVAHNAALTGKPGQVIATENEPSKASQARANWKEAGDEVLQVIDLREGDLLETLKLTLSPLGSRSLGAHGSSNSESRGAPPPTWSYNPRRQLKGRCFQIQGVN
uniref:O-methyltransferase n=1 Tax=Cryptococcus bacillisporus CA1280 TaxID=1296109 RepID=A0A0D0TLQ9_CRYGA|nr:O-methyltransferase [Cryptococcus bacillisporus CA1280]